MSRTPAPRRSVPPKKPDRLVTSLVVLIVLVAIALAVVILVA